MSYEIYEELGGSLEYTMTEMDFDALDAEAWELADNRATDAIKELLIGRHCDKERIAELSAMLGAVDMTDLAPVTSFGGCGRWDPAHYCCEALHEHPTVPQFLGELKRRVKECEE